MKLSLPGAGEQVPVRYGDVFGREAAGGGE